MASSLVDVIFALLRGASNPYSVAKEWYGRTPIAPAASEQVFLLRSRRVGGIKSAYERINLIQFNYDVIRMQNLEGKCLQGTSERFIPLIYYFVTRKVRRSCQRRSVLQKFFSAACCSEVEIILAKCLGTSFIKIFNHFEGLHQTSWAFYRPSRSKP